MSISLPPRPPELGDPLPVDQEALIKEARRRARRRRLRNLAGGLAAVLGALWLYSLLGGAGPQSGVALPPGSSSPLSVSRVGANGRIAFLAGWRTTSTPAFRIDTINPDGSGRLTLTRCTTQPSKCGFGAFAWSPDGTHFGFERGAHICCAPKGTRPNVHLYVVRADGRAEMRIPGCGPPSPGCGNFAWAPDNRRIAFARSGSLYVVDTRGGQPVRITRRPLCCDSGPFWSPDGSTILFQTNFLEKRHPGIYRVGADRTGLTKLADGGQPSWSPDGQHIVFANAGNSISTMDAHGSNVTALFSFGNGPKGTSPGAPVWSPDGTQIAFALTPDMTPAKPGGFSAEIWTIRTDGSDPRRLYHSRPGISGPSLPVWSPDGKLIAFAGPQGGNGVYLVHADGRPRLRLLTAAAAGFAWQSKPTR